jgi:outer membrane protein OmpA-like peptidoglycan-associated protein
MQPRILPERARSISPVFIRAFLCSRAQELWTHSIPPCTSTGLLIILAVSLIASPTFAQNSNPQPHSFVPYQWLHPRVPVANCSVQPNEVVVGEPVTATVHAGNFNPRHTLMYVWHPSDGDRGKVIGQDATAQIETTDAAPGRYTVSAYVADVKEKGKNQASCMASFIVKPLPPKNPPTMSISASPMTVPLGGTVNLSAHCTSPDGVPVTVSTWVSVGGTVSGTGSLATLNTAGASPGATAVSATCTDSRGLNIQASIEVMVENLPAPPPSPQIEAMESTLALHSIYFPTAMPAIASPDAGLVASQRQTLVALAAGFKKYLEIEPEAHLILEGYADPRGPTEYNQQLSRRRAGQVKSFLVELGISEASIDTQAFGTLHTLGDAEVRDAVWNNLQLSPEERQKALSNMQTIVFASDRRVDITLSTTGQSSVRQFPFQAADAATLIGGQKDDAKNKAAKAAPATRANQQSRRPSQQELVPVEIRR